MKHSQWFGGFTPGVAGQLPRWSLSCNVVTTKETLRVPADFSLVVVDTLDVVGTIDNEGNIGVI
jgi:hypothetical protein